MRILKNRKRKRKLFIFKKAVNLLSHKGRRTILVGKEELYVFKCGENTVVYKRDQVVFNSVISDIPYSSWMKKYKREKGIID